MWQWAPIHFPCQWSRHIHTTLGRRTANLVLRNSHTFNFSCRTSKRSNPFASRNILNSTFKNRNVKICWIQTSSFGCREIRNFPLTLSLFWCDIYYSIVCAISFVFFSLTVLFGLFLYGIHLKKEVLDLPWTLLFIFDKSINIRSLTASLKHYCTMNHPVNKIIY